MVKTNWQDPGSSKIVSTHIAGLQEAIAKIEDLLDINIIAESNLQMTEVFIKDTDRYRIFQVANGKKNWLVSPAPVIKKNGIIITDGFSIEYGGGAIILTTNALSTDVFTADATHTINSSEKIAALYTSVNSINTSITSINTAIAELNNLQKIEVINDTNNDFAIDMQNKINKNIIITFADTIEKTISLSNINSIVENIIALSIIINVTAVPLNVVYTLNEGIITWQNETPPTFVEGKIYRVSFMSYDNGATWLASLDGEW